MPSLDAEGLEMALSELSGYVALFRLCQLGRGKGALGPAPAICDQRCGRLQARPGGRGSGLDAALAFLVSGRRRSLCSSIFGAIIASISVMV